MLPVNSEVKTAEVTGEQIWNWLESELENAFAKDPTKRFGGWFVRFKGMKVTFTIGNNKGSRVQKVLVKDKPVNLKKTYTMVACLREGDPDDMLCRMKNTHNPTPKGIFLHDVLEEYLAKYSPVAPKLEGRAIATDAAPTLLTQVDGVNYKFR